MPDRAEFEAAVLPHLAAAYNLARWLVGERSLAEDIVQDAFLRAWSYFGSYGGGDARAWLLRIVRNTAYDAMAARARRMSPTPDPETPDPADNPETALARSEEQERLRQRLGALPAELRECLVLRVLEGLSYKQVASVTGVPIGTVMSRLWRARRALAAGGQEA